MSSPFMIGSADSSDFKFLNLNDSVALSSSPSESVNLTTSFPFLGNFGCLEGFKVGSTLSACFFTVYVGLGVEALSPNGCEAPSNFADFFDFTTGAC